MKLDASGVRFLTPEQHRMLTALEVGSRNHELVPLSLLCSISGQRPSGALSILSALAAMKLTSKESACAGKYEGFRLCAGGYDYLALKKFVLSGCISHVGSQIGVGKESDVYLAYREADGSEEGSDFYLEGNYRFAKESNNSRDGSDLNSVSNDKIGQCADLLADLSIEGQKPLEYASDLQRKSDNLHSTLVLKIHRLGRTSFRNVRNTRDYTPSTGKSESCNSWLKLSRCSAEREYSFMQALWKSKFPVPKPIAQNRHCILMEYIEDGVLLNAVDSLSQNQVESLYSQALNLLFKLASHGLIHGDFNEFNLLVVPAAAGDDFKLVMIDFPQMISTGHPNAEEYFQRDLNCIYRFFERRFGYVHEDDGEVSLESIEKIVHLDALLEASGYDKKQRREEIKRIQALEKQEQEGEEEETN